jgi:3-dehydroquinate dehydratase/shikimate dehydrogenase
MTPPSPGGDELRSLPDEVEWLEVRADLVGDLDIQWLRRRFGGKLIYTLRSRDEGGNCEDSLRRRHERLKAAAKDYDLVELEGERDVTADLLDRIPVFRRMISWQGPAGDLSSLSARFEKLSAVAARLYKLVVVAAKAGDEVVPLSLIKRLGRSDVIAYATGQIGFWSRLVSPYLGSPSISGVVGSSPPGSAEPGITRLIEDYGFPSLGPLKELNGIVGNPVFHSLSPRLHNAAYRALGHAGLFVPFHVESFDDFWLEVVQGQALETLGLSVNGLTVASPHKESALSIAEMASPMSQRAGAANIFIRCDGHWTADTTDPQGAILALRERELRLQGKRAAVVGCGGAGRAIAATLDQEGAQVTLINRGMERGLKAVQLTGLPFIPLSEFKPDGFNIIVNATPVGRDDDQIPFDVAGLSTEAIVIDLVYGSAPSPLMTLTRALGCITVDGLEVLLIQVRHQFRMMTGREMPVELALDLLRGERVPALSSVK